MTRSGGAAQKKGRSKYILMTCFALTRQCFIVCGGGSIKKCLNVASEAIIIILGDFLERTVCLRQRLQVFAITDGNNKALLRLIAKIFGSRGAAAPRSSRWSEAVGQQEPLRPSSRCHFPCCCKTVHVFNDAAVFPVLWRADGSR